MVERYLYDSKICEAIMRHGGAYVIVGDAEIPQNEYERPSDELAEPEITEIDDGTTEQA